MKRAGGLCAAIVAMLSFGALQTAWADYWDWVGKGNDQTSYFDDHANGKGTSGSWYHSVATSTDKFANDNHNFYNGGTTTRPSFASGWDYRVTFRTTTSLSGSLYIDVCNSDKTIVFVANGGSADYGVNSSGLLQILNDSSLQIESGTYVFNEVDVSKTANKSGTVKVSGGTLSAKTYICVGYGGSGNLVIDNGGLVNHTNDKYLSIGHSGGNGTVTIKTGGTYENINGNGNAIMANASDLTGTLNIEGGTFKIKGTLYLNYNSSAKSSTVSVTDGGILMAKSVVLANAGTNGGTVTFDGGTLKAYADNAAFLPAFSDATKFRVYAGANGATIDADNHNITIGAVLENKSGEAGVVTFTGGGTITLSGTPSYTGGTTNVAGTVLSLTSAAKAAIVANPVAVEIPATGAADGTVVFEVASGTFTAAEVSAMTITGTDASRYRLELSDSDTKVVIVDTLAGEYVWNDGASAASWRTSGKWTKNGSAGDWYDSTAAVFENAGDSATVDADVTAASVTFRADATIAAGGGTLTPGTVAVSNGVSAAISAPTDGSLVKEGPGTLILSSSRTAQTDLTDGTLVFTGSGTTVDWSSLALGSSDAGKDVAIKFEDGAALSFPTSDTHFGIVPGRTTEVHKDGGDWNVGWNLILSSAKNATTRFYHRGGTTDLPRYVRIGYSGESDSGEVLFEISGGTVTNSLSTTLGYTDIGSNGKPGFRSILSVKTNATFGAASSIVVGGNGAGVLDIDGGTVAAANSTVSLCYGTDNEVGEDCAINIANGGLLIAKLVRYGESDSSCGAADATITFNDGTLRATQDGILIQSNDKLTVTVASGGGTIDANGKNVTIAEELAGVGGMTYKGGGIVTNSVAPTYSGTTTVEVGTMLVVPAAIAGANLEFTIPAGLATGVYKVMEVTGGGAFASDVLSSATLPSGANAGFFFDNDNKEIWCAYSSNASDHIWIGGSTGSLNDGANWLSGNVPTSGIAIIGSASAAELTNPDGSTFAAQRIVIPSGSAAITVSGAAFSGITKIENYSTSQIEFLNAVTFSANANVIQRPGIVKFTGGATGVQLSDATDIHGTYTFTGTGDRTEHGGTTVKSDGVYKLPNATFYKHNGDFSVEAGGKVEVGAAKINRSSEAKLLDAFNGEFKVNGEFSVSASGANSYITHYIASSGAGTFIVNGIRVITYAALVPRRKTIVGGGGIIRGNGYVRVYNSGTHEFGSYADWTMYHDNLGNTATDSPVFYKHNSTTLSTLTFNTTDYYDSTVARLITCEAPIAAQNSSSANNFAVTVNGIGKFVFANTSNGTTQGDYPTYIFSGGLTVNNSATVEVKANAWPGKGAVTLNGTSTLLMHTGGEARTGAITVNNGATLEVAESGTATLGGNLTLRQGAKLKFNVTTADTMATLALASGNTVSLPDSEGAIKVNVAAGDGLVIRSVRRATTEPFVLISGDAVTVDASKFELDNPPEWAGELKVVNGNLVLHTRAPGLAISVR